MISWKNFRITLLVRLAVLFCIGLCSMPSQAMEDTFPSITGTGQKISSIFDGLKPNSYIRDVLVLRRSPSQFLSHLTENHLSNLPVERLFAGPVSYFACPTGTVCGQPGTTQGPPAPCIDDDCDVFNITTVADPHKGTQEDYCGVDCCVDWEGCDIQDEPPTDLCDPECKSPIIIDVEGEGFHLTAAVSGVRFDIDGSGHPVQIAWTNPSFHNALLALPGKDGLVHNGKELFGNFTPQPTSPTPNGFAALAEYDKPENGGNGDGVIDQKDKVFASLRLWIDANHDGICQSSELHSLTEFGIYSLSLAYTESRRVDEFGNLFRYKARVNPGEQKDRRDNNQSGDPGRWTYDVFLRTQ